MYKRKPSSCLYTECLRTIATEAEQICLEILGVNQSKVRLGAFTKIRTSSKSIGIDLVGKSIKIYLNEGSNSSLGLGILFKGSYSQIGVVKWALSI